MLKGAPVAQFEVRFGHLLEGTEGNLEQSQAR
jgi:hypothetical protein